MVEKAYGGRLPWEPMVKACDIRKSGDTPKTLVISARRPVNMKLANRTSFCTSRETFSMVPGLGRPKSLLLTENESYVSLTTEAMALSVRNDRAELKSDMMEEERTGNGEEEQARD